MHRTWTISILFSLFFAQACTHVTAPTLYQKLGSADGIEHLVDALIQQIGHDPKVFHFFAEANIDHFRHGLTQHFCAISDGPCQYSGDSMKDIHHGMHIKEADFNHLVELLIQAMQQQNIATPTQNQLLQRLAPLRQDILQP